MTTEMNCLAGGGVAFNWIEPTYSNSNMTIEATWGYDAKTFVLIGKVGSYKIVWLFDLNQNVHYAHNSAYWYSNSTLSSLAASVQKLTARELKITRSDNMAFSDCYLLPVSDDSVLSYFS